MSAYLQAAALIREAKLCPTRAEFLALLQACAATADDLCMEPRVDGWLGVSAHIDMAVYAVEDVRAVEPEDLQDDCANPHCSLSELARGEA